MVWKPSKTMVLASPFMALPSWNIMKTSFFFQSYPFYPSLRRFETVSHGHFLWSVHHRWATPAYTLSPMQVVNDSDEVRCLEAVGFTSHVGAKPSSEMWIRGSCGSFLIGNFLRKTNSFSLQKFNFGHVPLRNCRTFSEVSRALETFCGTAAGCTPRIVLLIRFWHPELPAERWRDTLDAGMEEHCWTRADYSSYSKLRRFWRLRGGFAFQELKHR